MSLVFLVNIVAEAAITHGMRTCSRLTTAGRRPRDPPLQLLAHGRQPLARRRVEDRPGLRVDEVEDGLDRGQLEAVGRVALGEQLVPSRVETPRLAEAVDELLEHRRAGDVADAVAVARGTLEDVAAAGDAGLRVLRRLDAGEGGPAGEQALGVRGPRGDRGHLGLDAGDAERVLQPRRIEPEQATGDQRRLD